MGRATLHKIKLDSLKIQNTQKNKNPNFVHKALQFSSDEIVALVFWILKPVCHKHFSCF